MKQSCGSITMREGGGGGGGGGRVEGVSGCDYPGNVMLQLYIKRLGLGTGLDTFSPPLPPSVSDLSYLWDETLYLNLILHEVRGLCSYTGSITMPHRNLGDHSHLLCHPPTPTSPSKKMFSWLLCINTGNNPVLPDTHCITVFFWYLHAYNPKFSARNF